MIITYGPFTVWEEFPHGKIGTSRGYVYYTGGSIYLGPQEKSLVLRNMTSDIRFHPDGRSGSYYTSCRSFLQHTLYDRSLGNFGTLSLLHTWSMYLKRRASCLLCLCMRGLSPPPQLIISAAMVGACMYARPPPDRLPRLFRSRRRAGANVNKSRRRFKKREFRWPAAPGRARRTTALGQVRQVPLFGLIRAPGERAAST